MSESTTPLSLSDVENLGELSDSVPSRAPLQDDGPPVGSSSETIASLASANRQTPLNSAYQNHPRFTFDDGNVRFLVQGVLYRVHRYFFCRDSPYFVNLFSNRVTASPKLETITLDGVECSEFEAFLSILYPKNFHECELRTVEEWTSVLRLSTKWAFFSIRTLAIERLDPIASPIDKVILGRTYNIHSWLVPAITALCERAAPLTRDEGRRLGVDDVVLIAETREALRTPSLDASRDKIEDLVKSRLWPRHVEAEANADSEVDSVGKHADVKAAVTVTGVNVKTKDNADSGAAAMQKDAMNVPKKDTTATTGEGSKPNHSKTWSHSQAKFVFTSLAIGVDNAFTKSLPGKPLAFASDEPITFDNPKDFWKPSSPAKPSSSAKPSDPANARAVMSSAGLKGA